MKTDRFLRIKRDARLSFLSHAMKLEIWLADRAFNQALIAP
jgi:hypothetical protein